jgi:cob(I)alamin adenosyltransferase
MMVLNKPMPRSYHPRVQERLSEINDNISRLQSEAATSTEGEDSIQVLNDEIQYWRKELKNLKANPKRFIF